MRPATTITFISCRLDDCNSLPNTLLRKLRSVQHATARLITGTRRSDHDYLADITQTPLAAHPRARQLQTSKWHTWFASGSPGRRAYLADDCRLVSDSSRRSPQSADIVTCVVPRTMSDYNSMPRTLSSYGDRTFAAAGPRLWNSLPVQLRNPDINYGLFRRRLKGHFFGKHEHGAL